MKPEYIPYIALLLNLMGLVWGAAKISASVENLKEATSSMKKGIHDLRNVLQDHEVRISVIESK